MAIYYSEDKAHSIELFDHIEVQINGLTFKGDVMRIHPSASEVTVSYRDWNDPTKAGKDRRRSARVPISSIELIARDQ